MARPKKTHTPDLTQACDLTAGAIERLSCPAGKTQAFLRDSKAPGLRVRVTASGAKAYVFEAKLNKQTIRHTLGDVRAWSIEQARQEAYRLRVSIDAGIDPREVRRQLEAAQAAEKVAAAVQAVTVGEVWAVYLEARRPKWGERHYADHLKLSRAGGEKVNRGTRGRGVTVAMPLHSLMALPLRDLTAPVIEAWAAKEAQTRPSPNTVQIRSTGVGWCFR